MVTAAQIERARARVQAEHITILAHGLVKATGERFFIVRGSTGRQYTIQVGTEALACDCPAGEHGELCKHRVAVSDRLRAERATERERAERALAEERAASMRRQPVVRTISIFK